MISKFARKKRWGYRSGQLFACEFVYAVEKEKRESMYRHFFKRLLDIVLSLLGIIVLAIPMLIIAIIVKCTSKGPAIFKTERVGRNGKPFKFYKFRSMRVDAPKDCAPRLLHSEDT